MTLSLSDLAARIREKASRPGMLRAKACFDFGSEGRISVDSTIDPPRIDHEPIEADVTLLCTLDVFSGILEGKTDPAFAFLTGKLKVQGAMGLALKLNAFLED